MTTTGTFTEYAVPTSGSLPTVIVSGSDNRLWFTENGAANIGAITTGGTITEYPLSSGAAPFGITAGPDDNLWFTVPNQGYVGTITPSGTITPYSVSGGLGDYLTAAPDGDLVFDGDSSGLGQMTTSGSYTYNALPESGDTPEQPIPGSDDNVWLGVSGTNQLGVLPPEGDVIELGSVTDDTIGDLVDGPGGLLWYTNPADNTIGQFLPQATGTAISLSSATSVYGEAVTLDVTVTGTADTPTGSVTLLVDGTPTDTATLSDGTASFTIADLAVGSHSLSAVYTGDSNYDASTADPASETVAQADTTTTIASSANPAVYGQTITYTATVAAASPGAGTPTGTVTFFADSTEIGSGTLADDGFGNEVVALDVSTLALGSHTITATYWGDTNFNSDTSASPVSQAVDQADTCTLGSSAPNPSVYGQTITFTALVSAASPGAGTPTGTVTFYDSSTSLGTCTLGVDGDGNDVATLDVSNLSVGTHTITADYGGDTYFIDSSTATAVSQEVDQADTTTAIASSANPSVYGQTITLTATVGIPGSGIDPPTGTVTFYNGTTGLGTGTLSVNSSGYDVATLDISSLVLGDSTITAYYSGDTNFIGNTTATGVSQTVDQASTTTTLVSSVNPAVYGQTITFTATVSVSSPGAGLPTGTVTFYHGVTSLGTGTLADDGYGNDVATLDVSTFALGTYTITADYGGDTDFLDSSTATGVSQVVSQISTTTAVSSSNASTTYGDSVSFTADISAVSPGSGTPTGSVQFQVDGSNFGSPVTLVSGSATSGSTSTLDTFSRGHFPGGQFGP